MYTEFFSDIYSSFSPSYSWLYIISLLFYLLLLLLLLHLLLLLLLLLLSWQSVKKRFALCNYVNCSYTQIYTRTYGHIYTPKNIYTIGTYGLTTQQSQQNQSIYAHGIGYIYVHLDLSGSPGYEFTKAMV